VSKNLAEIGQGNATSFQVSRRPLANAEHLPDALKMHSQLCCEVHLELAEYKSTNVRAGQERTFV
jgi:hypothetical protein